MVVRRLNIKNAVWTDDAEKLSKFMVLKMRDNWRAKNTIVDKVFIGFPHHFYVYIHSPFLRFTVIFKVLRIFVFRWNMDISKQILHF